MSKDSPLIPIERIESSILLIRGQKVILSIDLAELYQVEPRALVQAVKRNIARFSEDFMFQLTEEEFPDFDIGERAVVRYREETVEVIGLTLIGVKERLLRSIKGN